METMVNDKKYIDMDKEYASKSVGGAALGIGIGALGLELLRNGGLNNLLGGVIGGTQPQSEEQSFFGLYKTMRDSDDAIVAKHNKDSFDLYKNQRDGYDALKAQIDALNTKIAIQEAVEPWRNKSIYDAIALEQERRCCNDGKIVNYSNLMFYPVSVADVTTGTTTTQRSVFNPLCGCLNGPTM
jgi:hypothetical protein